MGYGDNDDNPDHDTNNNGGWMDGRTTNNQQRRQKLLRRRLAAAAILIHLKYVFFNEWILHSSIRSSAHSIFSLFSSSSFASFYACVFIWLTVNVFFLYKFFFRLSSFCFIFFLLIRFFFGNQFGSVRLMVGIFLYFFIFYPNFIYLGLFLGAYHSLIRNAPIQQIVGASFFSRFGSRKRKILVVK